MISLLLHTYHKTQPLDISFNKTLSDKYSLAVVKWLKANSPKVVTIYQVSTLVEA